MTSLFLTIGGTRTDYGNLLINDYSYTRDGMGADFKSVRNSLRCTVVYDNALVAAILAETQRIKAEFIDQGQVIFTGWLAPLRDVKIDRTTKSIELSINDNNVLLDVYPSALGYTEGLHLCNPGTPSKSAVHILLGAIPVIDNAKLPTLTNSAAGTMDVYVPLASLNVWTDKTIFEQLTKLLEDNGYYHIFDAEGSLRIGCYAKNTATADYTLTDNDTIDGSVTLKPADKSDYKAEDSVRVRFRKIKKYPNQEVCGSTYTNFRRDDATWTEHVARRNAGTQAAIQAGTYVDNCREMAPNTWTCHKFNLRFQTVTDEKIVKFDFRGFIPVYYHGWKYPTNGQYTATWFDGNDIACPFDGRFGVMGQARINGAEATISWYHRHMSNPTFDTFPYEYNAPSGFKTFVNLKVAMIYADVTTSIPADTVITEAGPKGIYKDVMLDNCFSESTARTYARFYKDVILGGANTLAFHSYQDMDVGKIVSYNSGVGGLSFRGIVVKKTYSKMAGKYEYEAILTTAVDRIEIAEPVQLPDESAPGLGIGLNPDGTIAGPITSTNLPAVPENPPQSGIYLGGDKFGFFDAATGQWKVEIQADGDAKFTGEVAAASGKIGGWIIGPDKLTSQDGNIILNAADGSITAVSQEFRIQGVTNFDQIKLDTLAMDTDGDGDLVLTGGKMKAATTYLNPRPTHQNWSAEATLLASNTDSYAMVMLPDGRALLLYRESTTYKGVVRASGGTWGPIAATFTVAGALSVNACALNDGSVLLVYVSGTMVKQRILNSALTSWGAESTAVTPGTNLQRMAIANRADGVQVMLVEIGDAITLYERTSGTWSGIVETVQATAARYPAIIPVGLEGNDLYVAYQDTSAGIKFRSKLYSGGWSANMTIGTGATAIAPRLLNLGAGLVKCVYYNNTTDMKLSEKILSGMTWGAETIINNAVTGNTNGVVMLPDTTQLLVYRRQADGWAVMRTVDRTLLFPALPEGTTVQSRLAGMGVVERGSDSRGEYAKLADGMIFRPDMPLVVAEYYAAGDIGGNGFPFRYETMVRDTHNAVTLGTANTPTAWKFTAPITGAYTVFTGGYNTNGACQVNLYVNGIIGKRTTDNTNNLYLEGASLVLLNKGDTLWVQTPSPYTFRQMRIQIMLSHA